MMNAGTTPQGGHSNLNQGWASSVQTPSYVGSVIDRFIADALATTADGQRFAWTAPIDALLKRLTPQRNYSRFVERCAQLGIELI
jgi:hypothetical protein